MSKVYFLDVTNRDGVQTARTSCSKFQKTMINWYLAQLGVHQSEVGFPFLGHEKNYISANQELAEQGAMGAMILEGWCRAVAGDVEGALPTGVHHFNLSISTSDYMIKHKFRGKLDRGSVIKEMVAAVKAARQGGAETVGVNAEDGSRTDLEYLAEFCQAAKEAGAVRFRYCDTIGIETPYSIQPRLRQLAERIRMPIETHCHNDLGMGVANSVAGARGIIEGGQDAYINTTVNGIGERAGNADLLSCILAIKYGRGCEEFEIADPINLKVAWALGNYAAYAFRIPVSINQVGVGANAFAHESGIHADGALKDRHNYELYDYEAIGRTEQVCQPTGRVITVGEYSGLAGFRHVYERLGIKFEDDDHARYVLNLVQYADAHNQLSLTDDELRFIATYPEQVRKILTIKPPVEKGHPVLRSLRTAG